MKYIDAEKLIAEINNRLMSVNLEKLGNFGCHRIWAYNDVKDLITSLQQEMELPDKYQTPDWIWRKETIDQLAEEYVEGVKKCNDAPTFDLIHTAVCYGYELGLIARKEK